MSIRRTGLGIETFRSLRNADYRVWAAGALLSYVGTWMQRTAQDWLVLTQLTDHDAAAVGIVMALQFGPQILLLPVTGVAVDSRDRRKLIIATEAAMGALALVLGLLTLAGLVALWIVYLLALCLGCVAAFDTTARQTFVADLVGSSDLSNAVALNATSFNLARMVGPALAGVLVTAVGIGWVFIVDAATSLVVVAAMLSLRTKPLRRSGSPPSGTMQLVEGFRYVARRRDIVTVLVMLFLIGTFAINFPIFISTMTVTAFHAGAASYGLLTSIMAVGSVAGALLSAGLARPGMRILLVAAFAFGSALAFAALAPALWPFGIALIFVGLAAQAFTTCATSAVQLWTDPTMRGRVMAMVLAVLLGGTPIGAPAVGWIADRLGPRWAVGMGAAACFLAAAAAVSYLAGSRRRPEELVADRDPGT